MYKPHTKSRVALSSIPEKCELAINYKRKLNCVCVGLFRNGGWGEPSLSVGEYPSTALVEQVLHRESSNPMQLIHTKTSLNLSLTTIGYRLSASIVGGARDHPCEAKWRPVMWSIHATKVTRTSSETLNHSTWARSWEKMWDFFPTEQLGSNGTTYETKKNHLLCFIYTYVRINNAK